MLFFVVFETLYLTAFSGQMIMKQQNVIVLCKAIGVAYSLVSLLCTEYQTYSPRVKKSCNFTAQWSLYVPPV